MKETRLIKIIRTFNKEEWKSFEKFLQSPFLKPAMNTIPLFDYLLKFQNDFDSPKLSKEIVFKKLFPGESYNEKKIQNLIFYLTKAAEDFMVQNIFVNDELEYLLILSKALLNKKLPEESNRINKAIEKKIKPSFSPDKDYFSKFRRLSYLKSSYFIETNDFRNIVENQKTFFRESATHFIINFADFVRSIKIAEDSYGIKTDDNFTDTIIKSFDIENILKNLEKTDFKNKTIILIHFYLLKMNYEPEEPDYYYCMRDLFYKNIKEFERDEKYIILNHLVSYCIDTWENGNIKFRNESLDVYKKMLETDAYSSSENESMHVMTYRNIIQNALVLKEFKWAEYFIENYTGCLESELCDNMRNLSYGNLYFKINNFEKSLEHYSKIKNEFFIFKTDVKNSLLRVYYELKYFESAFALVDSYKHYLANSTEISKQLKVGLRNFLNYYFEILKITTKTSKENPEFIRKKIEKESKLTSREWLLQKSDELIK